MTMAIVNHLWLRNAYITVTIHCENMESYEFCMITGTLFWTLQEKKLFLQSMFFFGCSGCYTFIQQGCIKLIKCDSKDIHDVIKISISNKSCSFKLSIHQRLKYIYSQFHKIWSSTTIFKMYNNLKCLLSSKSAYSNDFWRIMLHWRMMLKIQLWPHK